MFTLLLLTASIGDQIFINECSARIEHLTHWGLGEEFASFGIGHFIWYAKDKQGPFEETFPSLLAFLEKHGETLPEWLQNKPSCPWQTREDFYNQIQTPKMIYLRNLLSKTKDLQAFFMTERLKKKFPEMIAPLSDESKKKVVNKFNKLIQTKKGSYALIDYLNFKGSGTSPSETYQGKGWGLLQVLLNMPDETDELKAFSQTAKNLLIQRVALSPPERNEKKWLSGWLNRVDTYLENDL